MDEPDGSPTPSAVQKVSLISLKPETAEIQPIGDSKAFVESPEKPSIEQTQAPAFPVEGAAESLDKAYKASPPVERAVQSLNTTSEASPPVEGAAESLDTGTSPPVEGAAESLNTGTSPPVEGAAESLDITSEASPLEPLPLTTDDLEIPPQNDPSSTKSEYIRMYMAQESILSNNEESADKEGGLTTITTSSLGTADNRLVQPDGQRVPAMASISSPENGSQQILPSIESANLRPIDLNMCRKIAEDIFGKVKDADINLEPVPTLKIAQPPSLHTEKHKFKIYERKVEKSCAILIEKVANPPKKAVSKSASASSAPNPKASESKKLNSREDKEEAAAYALYLAKLEAKAAALEAQKFNNDLSHQASEGAEKIITRKIPRKSSTAKSAAIENENPLRRVTGESLHNFDCRLTDSNIDEKLAYIATVVTELCRTKPTKLVKKARTYNLHFRVLRRAITGDHIHPVIGKPLPLFNQDQNSKEDLPSPETNLSIDSKIRILCIFVHNHWIKMISNYFHNLLVSTYVHLDGGNSTWEIYAEENISIALEVLNSLLWYVQRPLYVRFYENLMNTLLNHLRHRNMERLIVTQAPSNIAQHRLVINIFSMVYTLFSHTAISRDHINEQFFCKMEVTLRKYLKYENQFTDELFVAVCKQCLQVVLAEHPITKLGLNLKQSELKTEQVYKDFIHSKESLLKATIDDHMNMPRKLYPIFSKLRTCCSDPHRETSCKTVSKQFLVQELVDDPKFSNLLIELYNKAKSELTWHQQSSYWSQKKCSELETMQLGYLITNLCEGFLIVANLTEWCKDLQVLEKISNTLLDLVVQELENPTIITSLSSRVKQGATAAGLSYLGRSMLVILHNLLFLYEPCISTLVKREVPRIISSIQNKNISFDLISLCTLSQAYLLKHISNDYTCIPSSDLKEIIDKVVVDSLAVAVSIDPKYTIPTFISSKCLLNVAVRDLSMCELISDRDKSDLLNTLKSANLYKYPSQFLSSLSSKQDKLVVPTEENEKREAIPPIEDEESAAVHAREDGDRAPVSPREDGDRAVVSTREDGKRVTISAREDGERVVAPPTGDEESTVAPPTGDEERTVAPPTGDEERTVAPPTGDEERTVAPPTEDEERTVAPPMGDEERTVVPARKDRESSGVPGRQDGEKAVVPAREDGERAVTPREDVERAAGPAREDEKGTAAPPAAVKKSAAAVPAREDEEEAAAPPIADEERAAVVPAREDEEEADVPVKSKGTALESEASDIGNTKVKRSSMTVIDNIQFQDTTNGAEASRFGVTPASNETKLERPVDIMLEADQTPSNSSAGDTS